jgi:hypothetical protein
VQSRNWYNCTGVQIYWSRTEFSSTGVLVHQYYGSTAYLYTEHWEDPENAPPAHATPAIDPTQRNLEIPDPSEINRDFR